MIEISSIFPVKGYIDSKIGGRAENQDACSYQDTPLGLLVLVCDGMGGMNGGNVASSLAVQTIIAAFMEADENDSPHDVIISSANAANDAIRQASAANPSLAGMGTTLTLLLLTERCAYTTYLGDSRIYQLRGKEKVYRTFDHSVVFQLVRQGVITEEQARLSSQSNVIMQALGVKPEIDVLVEELPYEKGDRFVLCTDGFWGCMSEPEILSRICAKKELALIVHNTVMEIDGKGAARGGGHDNLTVALLEVQNDSTLKGKMNKKTKILLACLAALLLVSLALNVVLGFKKPVVKDSELALKNKELQQKDSAQTILVKELRDSVVTCQNANKTLSDEKIKMQSEIKELRRELDVLKDRYIRKNNNQPK